jgi:hypothetical protein
MAAIMPVSPVGIIGDNRKHPTARAPGADRDAKTEWNDGRGIP